MRAANVAETVNVRYDVDSANPRRRDVAPGKFARPRIAALFVAITLGFSEHMRRVGERREQG